MTQDIGQTIGFGMAPSCTSCPHFKQHYDANIASFPIAHCTALEQLFKHIGIKPEASSFKDLGFYTRLYTTTRDGNIYIQNPTHTLCDLSKASQESLDEFWADKDIKEETSANKIMWLRSLLSGNFR